MSPFDVAGDPDAFSQCDHSTTGYKKDIGPVACKFYLVSTSPPVRNLEHAPDHHLQKYGCEQKRHALPSAATAYLQHALPCLV